MNSSIRYELTVASVSKYIFIQRKSDSTLLILARITRFVIVENEPKLLFLLLPFSRNE
jgi:hypothetical protein